MLAYRCNGISRAIVNHIIMAYGVRSGVAYTAFDVPLLDRPQVVIQLRTPFTHTPDASAHR
jgi:hypothetical protein